MFFIKKLLFLLVFFTYYAQAETDSLLRKKDDSLSLKYQMDLNAMSLIIKDIQVENQRLYQENDSLKKQKKEIDSIRNQLESKNKILEIQYETLRKEVEAKEKNIVEKEKLLIEKNKILSEKETLSQQKLTDIEMKHNIDLLNMRLEQNKFYIQIKDTLLKEQKIKIQDQLTSIKYSEKVRDSLYKQIQNKEHLLTMKEQQYHENQMKSQQDIANLTTDKKVLEVKLEERIRELKIKDEELKQKKEEDLSLKDKRSIFKIIQGFSGSTIITNDYTLQAREKEGLDNNGNKQYEYVIANKNKANIEVAFPIAVGIMLFDWKKQDLKQTFNTGLFIGTGTTSFFKDFFLGVTQKLDVVQIGFGLNMKQTPILVNNFKEGDVVTQGINIPTENVFKFGFFFCIGIDGEAFSKLYKYIK